MNPSDEEMLQNCIFDIVEKLRAGGKFKALLVKKRVFPPDVIDEIFQGQDKHDSTFRLVQKLLKQTSAAIDSVIAALEETGQLDLAEAMKNSRSKSARSRLGPTTEELRHSVRDALARGSEDHSALQEGMVVVDRDYIVRCRQFAWGGTDGVPGTLQFEGVRATTMLFVSRACADGLARHLGGHVQLTVALRHNGFVLVKHSNGEAVMLSLLLLVIQDDSDNVMKGLWVGPEVRIQDTVKPNVQGVYGQVTDAAGRDVDVTKRWEDWWPDAPLGPMGRKELRVCLAKFDKHLIRLVVDPHDKKPVKY